MYAAAVTARAVAATNKSQGWDLVYHTPEQIAHAIKYLDDLYDPEAQRLTRPLKANEQRFISNERILCALDFRYYWAPRYATIIDWQKKPMHFTPNVAQNIILDLWGESESQGWAIWMQQLKARQLGVSTLSELAVQHRYQFIPYTNAVIASADPAKTLNMAGMIKYCFEQQPWWLLPKVTKIKSAIPVEFWEQYCSLTIQAGNQFNGVARGSTPNVIHLSELCEWQDAEQLIEAALLPAIHDTPDVFGILESTAQGPGYWKRKWEQTKRDYPQGRSRMRPAFLPWYVGTDLYPTAAELRQRPIPADWVPLDRTIKHAERARAYVTTDPLLLKYLAKGNRHWQLPREQMWWWESGYESHRQSKTLNLFLAEFCSDDFEAFQSSNVPVIDPEILMGYQDRTRNPSAVYTIIGPDIPPALTTPPRYWDRSRPTITIRTREVMPRLDLKFELVPILFEGYPSFDESMKLLVWEPPTAGYTYGIGVDCSEGIGQDFAVIDVLREATPSRAPGQVAEWASNTVTAFQLWPLILAVGCLYSTLNPLAGKRVQCRLAIETWSNGSAAQHELQKRGWLNFHPWMYAGDARKPKRPGETVKVGVMTNAWFRASMQDMFLTCLSEEAIDLPSPYLVSELTTLERAPGIKKAVAAADAYDDRFMALGMILYSLHMNKPPQQQFARRRVEYTPGVDPEPGISHPIWTPPAQASSTAFEGQVAHHPLSRYAAGRGAFGRIVARGPVRIK